MWELEADLGIAKSTVSEILMQGPGIKCVIAKFVLWLLLPEQKEHSTAGANNLIQATINEPDFLKKDMTLKRMEASLSSVQCFFYLLQ